MTDADPSAAMSSPDFELCGQPFINEQHQAIGNAMRLSETR